MPHRCAVRIPLDFLTRSLFSQLCPAVCFWKGELAWTRSLSSYSWIHYIVHNEAYRSLPHLLGLKIFLGFLLLVWHFITLKNLQSLVSLKILLGVLSLRSCGEIINQTRCIFYIIVVHIYPFLVFNWYTPPPCFFLRRFLCVRMFRLHVYEYCGHGWCSQRLEEDVRSPRIGVRYGYKPSHG